MALFGSIHAQTLPAYLPTNGLVGWWPFNGNANDESGNGNHGTVNGATMTADRNGSADSAYSFDGMNDFISATPTLPISSSPRTVSCWFSTTEGVIPSSQYPEIQTMTGWGNASSGAVIFPQQVLAPTGRAYFESGSSANQLFSQNPVNDGQWYNVVTTYEGPGTRVKIYIDGIIQDSSSAITLGTVNSYFGIGNAPWANVPFKGQLDDIAIYNRALTQEEITALYTGTLSNNNGGGGTAGTPAASVPAGIPYQAVIRDNAGAALVNTPVSVRFTLHQNTTDGTVEYQETQSLTTNAIGLINTQFGAGTATQGSFANINWSNTSKFIKVEANTGAGYVDMGTQQMMSVPFAIKSNESNKIKNAGLPVYADNAAALAGGLTPGEMYRTAYGDLKIVF
jgi:hypothetical protein